MQLNSNTSGYPDSLILPALHWACEGLQKLEEEKREWNCGPAAAQPCFPHPACSVAGLQEIWTACSIQLTCLKSFYMTVSVLGRNRAVFCSIGLETGKKNSDNNDIHSQDVGTGGIFSLCNYICLYNLPSSI